MPLSFSSKNAIQLGIFMLLFLALLVCHKQQELAEIAGVTNKAVSAWESGLSEPRMGAIEKIAARFNIKKSNIIEDDGMDIVDDKKSTSVAAYFKGEDYTEEEIKEILEYAKYLKFKRK